MWRKYITPTDEAQQSCLYTTAQIPQLTGQEKEGKEMRDQSRVSQQFDGQPIIIMHLHLELRCYCNQRLHLAQDFINCDIALKAVYP